jgi:hypothetical protein
MRHVAKVRVTDELIIEALHFPEGTKLLRIYESDPWIPKAGYHTLVIEHPDLPAVHEGAVIPDAMPLMQKDDGIVSMKDWGTK